MKGYEFFLLHYILQFIFLKKIAAEQSQGMITAKISQLASEY